MYAYVTTNLESFMDQMDRTSILGDTIDYVKELTERIKVLEDEVGALPEDLNLLNTLNDSSNNNNEMMVRNSTKVCTARTSIQHTLVNWKSSFNCTTHKCIVILTIFLRAHLN
jgi:hypothetical protein